MNDVAVWVIWNEGKRPADKDMEFTIRTDGDYYDQRMGAGEVLPFRFIGSRVNLTFRYDPVEADYSREDSIRVHAKVAEDFRAFYTEPTLFPQWQFSLPRYDGTETLQDGGDTADPEALNTIGLADLQGAVSGIRLEFSGTYIKDADRFFDEE